MKRKLFVILLICAMLSAMLTGASFAENAALIDTDDLFSKRDLSGAYDAGESETISLLGDTAQSDAAGVEISGGTVTITKEGTYILSGSLNGMVIVNIDKKDKVQLVLDGVTITSETSAAIYVIQADKVFVTLAKDSENALSNDGAFGAIDENDIDAVIFSKEDLTLNGTGSLTISSPAGDGIVSKDDLAVTGGVYVIDAAGHGLSGKDSVRIADGTFTITSGKDGIHSSNTEEEDKGFIAVTGGAFDITSGGDGIDAATVLQIDDGTFTIVAGDGSGSSVRTGGFGGGFRPMSYDSSDDGSAGFGTPDAQTDSTRTDFDQLSSYGGQWGGQRGGQQGGRMPGWSSTNSTSDSSASMKGIKADGDILITGGSFDIDSADDAVHSDANVTVTGGTLNIATGDDGIHANETLTVDGGVIDISQSCEGLEGTDIVVNDGSISVVSSDDGFNAAGGNDQSGYGGWGDMFGSGSNSLTINGGTVHVNAQGDGLDSNGTLVINGGTVFVSGPTNSGNDALDCGSTAVINGGTVVAVGASGMAAGFDSDSTQGSMIVNVGNQSAGSAVTLTDADGSVLLSWTADKTYQNVVVSCEGIKTGGTYTLTAGSYSETVTMTGITYGTSSGFGGGFGGGWGGRRP